MAAINSGDAVINLCGEKLFPFFVPLFMSLSLDELFAGEQDEMFVEALVNRLVSQKFDWAAYSTEQQCVVRDFLVLCVHSLVGCADDVVQMAEEIARGK